MTVNEKIAALRGEMAKANVDALIIPTSDPHMSEYIPEAWKARKEFSGFTGSAGTLVVTTEESGLWTDGRYFIQAEGQLSGSEIKLFRMREKGVPTVEEYLADTQAGKTVAVDGTLYPASSGLLLQEKLEKVGASLVSEDLVMPVWEGRPALPHTPAYVLDVKYAGLSPRKSCSRCGRSWQKSMPTPSCTAPWTAPTGFPMSAHPILPITPSPPLMCWC